MSKRRSLMEMTVDLNNKNMGQRFGMSEATAHAMGLAPPQRQLPPRPKKKIDPLEFANRIGFKDYKRLLDKISLCDPEDAKSHFRNLCRGDLYFLIRYGMNRPDIERLWLFDRCREVQAAPDGYIDLWAREAYKSTIITVGKTLQDIFRSHGEDAPVKKEQTFCIFSHTRPIAKGFLRQIKREAESNPRFKEWFPDVVWENPSSQAPTWSEDSGLIFRRESNPKEATVEAWGLVDGQPTSKHFDVLLYDDIVTSKSVYTPEMIHKTTRELELSYNLGAQGGCRRFIGTRYSFGDSYRTIIERGTAIPRIYPATEDGTVAGKPVLLTRDELAEKRRDMGSYTFSCFKKDTQVLMADWSQRNIENVSVGDMVVGYSLGKGYKNRASLKPSRVIAFNKRRADAVKIIFESGRYIVCTEDHKFWSGRSDRGYSALTATEEYGKQTGACSIYNPLLIDEVDAYHAGYLAAMIDGEGSITGSTIHISQCFKTHPKVCKLIEETLDACSLPWGVCIPSSRPQHRDYYITGGRQQHIRLANIVRNCGKIDKICDLLFKQGTRNIGKGARDAVVSIEPVGKIEVFNIQTETGNYIAGGYAAKNCQMLQNPVADSAQKFIHHWLSYHDPETYRGEGHHNYIIVDPAHSKKKTSDYTVMLVLQARADKKLYLMDGLRDRMSLTERAQNLVELHKKWKPMIENGVRYERYGAQADIEHIKDYMDRTGYRFEITEVGGKIGKTERILRLVPYFQNGKLLLPYSLVKSDYEGNQVDLIKIFVEEEYLAFPHCVHDDILDCLARAADPLLPLVYPEDALYNEKHAAGHSGSRLQDMDMEDFLL